MRPNREQMRWSRGKSVARNTQVSRALQAVRPLPFREPIGLGGQGVRLGLPLPWQAVPAEPFVHHVAVGALGPFLLGLGAHEVLDE